MLFSDIKKLRRFFNLSKTFNFRFFQKPGSIQIFFLSFERVGFSGCFIVISIAVRFHKGSQDLMLTSWRNRGKSSYFMHIFETIQVFFIYYFSKLTSVKEQVFNSSESFIYYGVILLSFIFLLSRTVSFDMLCGYYYIHRCIRRTLFKRKSN